MKLLKKLFNLLLIPMVLIGMLNACGTRPDNEAASTPYRTAPTATPALLAPTRTAFPSPTATPASPDDEQALAKATFPSGDQVLCNWQILGKNEQELYAWVFCQMVAAPHGATSAPVVIKLNPNGHYSQLILYEDEASTLELFPAAVRKRAVDQDFDFTALTKRMIERLADPTLPPLIITAGALDVPPNPPLPTHTPAPTRPVLPTYFIPTVPINPTVRIKLLRHWGEGSLGGEGWSPDGKQIVVIRGAGISFHDAATLQETHFIPFDQPVRSMAYSPDGKKLAVGLPGEVLIWDLTSGQTVRTLKCNFFAEDLVFSPDGTRLLGSIEQQSTGVVLWDVESGRELQTLPQIPDTFRNVFFSADGQALAWQRDGSSHAVWDVLKGAIIRSLATDWTFVSAYNQDGSFFATGGNDGLIQVWQPEGDSFKHLKTYSTGMRVNQLAFNPATNTLAFDDGQGKVQVWDWQGNKMLASIPAADLASPGDHTVNDLSFSPDGKVLLTEVQGQIQIWDTQAAKSLASFEDSTREAEGWFLDSDRLVMKLVNREGTRLVDAKSGALIHSVPARTENPNPILAISPNGQWVATSDGAWTFDLVAAGTSLPVIHIQKAPGGLGGEIFSPDSKKLLVYFNMDETIAGPDPKSTLELWDIPTGKMVYALETPLFDTAIFDPGGQWFALGSHDRYVYIYAAQNGQLLQTLQGHTENVTALAVSAGSSSPLLATGSQDGTVCLWDTQTWKLIRILGPKIWNPRGNIQDEMIVALALSPDGNFLISATIDGALRFWNPRTGELLGEQDVQPGGIASLSISGDGSKIVTGGWDGTVRMWGK